MDNTVSLLPSYADTDLCSRSWQQSRDILYQEATTSLEAKKSEFGFYEHSYTSNTESYRIQKKICISVGVTVQALYIKRWIFVSNNLYKPIN